MSHETILVILFAVSAGALVKGLSGLGLPMVAIPLMAGFFGVEQSVALMVVPSMLTNMWQLWNFRRHAVAFPNMPTVTVLSIFGVIVGSWILASVPERWLVGLLAVWLGLYLVALAFHYEPRIEGAHGRFLSFAIVWFAGLMQGATGAAGPVVGPYAHALGLRKGAYVFAVSVLFQIFGMTQIAALAWHGVLTVDRLYEGAVACVPVLVVMPLAMRVSGKFTTRGFELMLLAVFVLMEARLIYRIVA